MKILLVAGHGEGDVGACGCGYREAELARELVEQLKKQLKAHMTVDVFDVRKNLYAYLSSGKPFNFKPYDYVLEIHFNAAAFDEKGNGKTTGTECLVHTAAGSRTVEEKILNKVAAVGYVNRGVKRRSNLFVMNVCKKQNVAYGLLEVCFIDDKDDMNLYQIRKETVIQGIADGLLEGFGIQYNKVLETANDIVWELNHRGIISDTALWLKKLEEDQNAYWLARKTVNYLANM